MKKLLGTLFNKENTKFTILFMLMIGYIIVSHSIFGFSGTWYLADLGAVLGVTQLILLIKFKKEAFLVNVAASTAMGLNFLFAGVYFNFIVYCFITNAMMLIGYFRWGDNSHKDKDQFSVTHYIKGKRLGLLKELKHGGINTLTLKQWVVAIAVVIISYFGMSGLSKTLGGEMVWLDSAASITYLFALILVTFRFIEQYIVFMVNNIITGAVYILMAVNDISNLSLLIMLVIFFIFNIIGLKGWLSKLRKQQEVINQHVEHSQQQQQQEKTTE